MRDELLLVEDEESVAESIRAALDGSKIDWAEDSRTALTLWAVKRYAVAIVDLKLPGEMQGLDLIRAMQLRQPQTAEFIVLTGYPEDESLKEALEIGVGDYIVKPHNVTHLRHSVDMAKTRVQLREGRLGLVTVQKQVTVLERKFHNFEKR